MLITLHLCVLCGSQNKEVTFVLNVINRLVFITEVQSVYCAVRTDTFHPQRVKSRLVRQQLSRYSVSASSTVNLQIWQKLLRRSNSGQYDSFLPT
jgi:hypothetical protein